MRSVGKGGLKDLMKSDKTLHGCRENERTIFFRDPLMHAQKLLDEKRSGRLTIGKEEMR